MIPPLFLRPPVDKSFSFIAQTQGLQVHRPQKRERRGFGGGGGGSAVGGGGGGVRGWRSGWEGEWSVGR